MTGSDDEFERMERKSTSSGTDHGRALLTDNNRKIQTGEKEVSSGYKYKEDSIIRQRILKELPRDLDILEANNPELFELIYELTRQEEKFDLGSEGRGRQITVSTYTVTGEEAEETRVGIGFYESEGSDVKVGELHSEPGSYALVRVTGIGGEDFETIGSYTDLEHEVVGQVDIEEGGNGGQKKGALCAVQGDEDSVLVVDSSKVPGRYFLVYSPESEASLTPTSRT